MERVVHNQSAQLEPTLPSFLFKPFKKIPEDGNNFSVVELRVGRQCSAVMDRHGLRLSQGILLDGNSGSRPNSVSFPSRGSVSASLMSSTKSLRFLGEAI
jgi:hypothetical protein